MLPHPLTSFADDSNGYVDEYFDKAKKQNPTEDKEIAPDQNKDSKIVETPELQDETPASSERVSVTAGDYIKMILALLLVVGLLFVVLRFLNSKNRSFQQNRLIQNLGGMGVGQGKSVQLMQIGNSLYLVGIGDNITLLKEITDPNEIENLTSIYEEKATNGKAIPYILEMFQRFKKGNDVTNNNHASSNTSFNETFQRKLQEVKKDRSDVLKDWKTKERNDHE